MADYTLTADADVFPGSEDLSGDDRIYGLAGDDILTGGPGADLLDGGEGFDTVTYANATVGIYVNPMSRVPRNDGTADSFVSVERFILSAFNDYFRVDQSFTAGIELDGGAGNDRVYATGFADTLDGGEGDDELRGGEGSDIVRGGIGNDALSGEGGRDQLFGGDGDDLLNGGTNNDIIDGGEGFDTVVLYDGPSYYELSLQDDGAVKILRLYPEYEDSGQTTLNGSFDLLTNVERLRYYDGTIFDLAAWIEGQSVPAGYLAQQGTDAGETLTGTEEKDALYGLGGADTLIGGDGDDLLSGGAGGDTFDGGDGTDTVTYRNASGGVAVNVGRAPFSTEDPKHEAFGDTFSNIERIELSAFDDTLYWTNEEGVTVLGDIGKDIIVTNIGDDRIDGGTGDDVLAGLAGDDVITGGDGADRLEGGDGDDLLDGGLGRDSIYGGLGTDTLTFTGRTTGIKLGGSSQQPPEDEAYYSIEIFRLTDFDDSIRLYASYSDEGYAGISDVYAGGGNDVVDGGVVAGKIYGEDGNDTLTAAHYGSLIDGGAGDDILNSAWGGDSIEGGDGTDTVFYDRPRSEYFIERDGDSIIVAHVDSGFVDHLTGVEYLSFPDPVFLERLVIDVSTIEAPQIASAMRMGSVAADMMAGEMLTANALFGLAGTDSLTGGDEGDMLSGGDDDDSIAGSGGDDSLYGGGGNDALDGGLGADAMTGGAGNDVYQVDDAGDSIVESDGEGTDEVRTALGSATDYAALYTLAANVENFTGTAATGQGVTLNALDNQVKTGAGADLLVLDGGGNDSVFSGGGNDFLYFGGAFSNGDTVDAGAGIDTVGLVGTYTLSFDSDDLVGVEKLAVYSSGDPSAPAGYSLTMADSNVAAGQTLTVIAQSLQANEALLFNGAAEKDGAFDIKGGRGADTVTGGAGNDVIWANLGADMLKGGAGRDSFIYLSTAESTRAEADTILDFTRGDRIYLRGIDADANAANGDNAFSWIGGNAFSGHAGELRVTQDADHPRAWLVEADTDGNGAADFALYLVGDSSFIPQSGDFTL